MPYMRKETELQLDKKLMPGENRTMLYDYSYGHFQRVYCATKKRSL
jgi:hypothetical protein